MTLPFDLDLVSVLKVALSAITGGGVQHLFAKWRSKKRERAEIMHTEAIADKTETEGVAIGVNLGLEMAKFWKELSAELEAKVKNLQVQLDEALKTEQKVDELQTRLNEAMVTIEEQQIELSKLRTENDSLTARIKLLEKVRGVTTKQKGA